MGRARNRSVIPLATSVLSPIPAYMVTSRTGMPRIAEAARAARREQIIAAGMACFARSGYHATTMADVAAQARVSKGTPYLYFASKEALFLALAEEWDCGAGERVNAAIAALPDGERRS